MFRSRLTTAARAAKLAASSRGFATASPSAVSGTVSAGRAHKVVVVGGGTAGLSISHQLLRSGKFTQDDIAVVDPAEWHHYQPGWTLVGGGLKDKEDLRRPLKSLVDDKLKFYGDGVKSFAPEDNSLTLAGGDKVTYEQLVVAPGVQVYWDSVKGLEDALADRHSTVSSIYGYDTCDKAFRTIDAFRRGSAIFTQPAGPIKCAGAPQKIMWLGLDYWKQAGLYEAGKESSLVKITFATGMPSMFAVPRYAATLEQLRKDRGVEGLFQHDLVAIDGDKAVFAAGGQDTVTRRFDLLHVTPKMGPHAFVKQSPLANEAGYVDVDDFTTRHKKFANVWSAGDASSLPNSKTAAAITAQAPVLVENLLAALEGAEGEPQAKYDGYASCPLVTEYGKVLLAEFKYGGVPQETFDSMFSMDQSVPRRSFYYLKKDFFPWVYYSSLVKGTWGGPKGWLA